MKSTRSFAKLGILLAINVLTILVVATTVLPYVSVAAAAATGNYTETWTAVSCHAYFPGDTATYTGAQLFGGNIPLTSAQTQTYLAFRTADNDAIPLGVAQWKVTYTFPSGQTNSELWTATGWTVPDSVATSVQQGQFGEIPAQNGQCQTNTPTAFACIQVGLDTSGLVWSYHNTIPTGTNTTYTVSNVSSYKDCAPTFPAVNTYSKAPIQASVPGVDITKTNSGVFYGDINSSATPDFNGSSSTMLLSGATGKVSFNGTYYHSSKTGAQDYCLQAYPTYMSVPASVNPYDLLGDVFRFPDVTANYQEYVAGYNPSEANLASNTQYATSFYPNLLTGYWPNVAYGTSIAGSDVAVAGTNNTLSHGFVNFANQKSECSVPQGWSVQSPAPAAS